MQRQKGTAIANKIRLRGSAGSTRLPARCLGPMNDGCKALQGFRLPPRQSSTRQKGRALLRGQEGQVELSGQGKLF